ncbi:hypothetical protein AVEN_186063-1 [Araneus ventricosus]|uniref:Uncharacterized protein n=1 Tax=Araneus ventricosus TaxID=182803 RepID=A0A4Y2K0M9_ARAVE|nr:hypothetical protein AVEN_186063-1 [Araneus ventricosus]
MRVGVVVRQKKSGREGDDDLSKKRNPPCGRGGAGESKRPIVHFRAFVNDLSKSIEMDWNISMVNVQLYNMYANHCVADARPTLQLMVPYYSSLLRSQFSSCRRPHVFRRLHSGPTLYDEIIFILVLLSLTVLIMSLVPPCIYIAL